MITRFLLIRHASCERMGEVLAGRSVDTPLSAEGDRQAKLLAERLADMQDVVLQTSPRQRTQRTAAAIAAHTGALPEVETDLDEVDFGEWSGRTFRELHEDQRWHLWNTARTTQRAPGGESILEVQARIVAHLSRQRERYGERCIVQVSHAEVIRCALLYYLGAALDAYNRIEISPAAISTLDVGDTGAKILAINERIRL